MAMFVTCATVACTAPINSNAGLSAIDAKIEKDKRSVELISDRIVKSLSNVCGGRYIYYYLAGVKQENLAYVDFSNFEQYELVDVRINRITKYIKAKSPTEVESLNNVRYHDKIVVSYTISNRKNSSRPVILRKRAAGEDWTAWSESRIPAFPDYFSESENFKKFAGDGKFRGYYPFFRLIFKKTSGGVYELEGLFTVQPALPLSDGMIGKAVLYGAIGGSRVNSDVTESIDQYMRSNSIYSPDCDVMKNQQYAGSNPPIQWIPD